jgi:transcriptional regulator with XRE-family HTH domain
MLADLNKALAHNLAGRRVAARMTQSDLAKAVNATGLGLGWTRSQVAAFEGGRRHSGLRLVEVIALCRVHDVTLADLLLDLGIAAEEVASVIGIVPEQQGLLEELARLRARLRAAQEAISSQP